MDWTGGQQVILYSCPPSWLVQVQLQADRTHLQQPSSTLPKARRVSRVLGRRHRRLGHTVGSRRRERWILAMATRQRHKQWTNRELDWCFTINHYGNCELRRLRRLHPDTGTIWSLDERGEAMRLHISKDSSNSKFVSAWRVLNVLSELGHTWNQEEGVQSKLLHIARRMETLRSSGPSYREASLGDRVGIQYGYNHEGNELLQRTKMVFPWKKSLPRIQKTFGSSTSSLDSILQELKKQGYYTLRGSLELENRIIPWLYSEKTSHSTKNHLETSGLMDTANKESSSSKSSASAWEQHSACVIRSRLWWKSKEDSLTWWQATTSSSPTLSYKTAMKEASHFGGMPSGNDSFLSAEAAV